SGGYDGAVRRAVAGRADAQPLYRHDGSVRAVAVSGVGPDQVIVSGGYDGAVRRAVAGRADAQPLYRHDGPVRAVAVSGVGPDQAIVSGGYDRCVRMASHTGREVATLLTNSPIACLALSREAPDLVVGLMNGQVLHVRIENHPAPPR